MKIGRVCGLGLLAWAPLMAAGGCGGRASDDDARRATAAANVCQEIVAINCAWMQKCFNDEWFRPQFGDGLDACLAVGKGDDCLDWMKLPGVTEDRETYIACTPLFAQLSCGDDIPEECEARWQGTLKEGARCIYPVQCQSGVCEFTSLDALRYGDSDGCGRCSAPSDDSDDRDGLPEGSCTNSSHCTWDDYCLDGACVPRLEKGAACVTGEDVCRGLYRECSDGTCTAPLDARVGEPCGPSAEGYRQCVGSRCAYDHEGPRCVEWTRKGDPCIDADECEGSSVCYRGVCRTPTVDMCRG